MISLFSGRFPSILALVIGIIIVIITCPVSPGYINSNVAAVQSQNSRNAIKLENVVEKLRAKQHADDLNEKVRQKERLRFLQLHFPNIFINNTLSNLFIYGNGVRPNIHRNPIVFVQSPRSAGSRLRSCLEKYAAQSRLPMSDEFNVDGRIRWDNSTPGHASLRDKFRVHRGHYAFGICDKTNIQCSYFTMIRDPLDRAISSYHYCKVALVDTMCSVVNANRMTVREWILQQGNTLLRQFIFSSEMCLQDLPVDLKLSDFVMNKKHIPCWYRQKLILDGLGISELQKIVDYVLERLEHWFSVIGLFEEFGDSIKMFDYTYNVPFTECRLTKQPSIDGFDSFEEGVTMNNRANSNSPQVRPFDNPVERDYLLNDCAVRKALEADFKIYDKATQIFKRQRQILFNR